MKNSLIMALIIYIVSITILNRIETNDLLGRIQTLTEAINALRNDVMSFEIRNERTQVLLLSHLQNNLN